MTAAVEALWSRALRAANARGLLPGNKSRLTPGELAAEVARRGEDRLVRLVDAWYYPASYGHVHGMLSDEEATGLVAAIEAQNASMEIAPAEIAPPPVEKPPLQRPPDCELCGFPLTPAP